MFSPCITKLQPFDDDAIQASVCSSRAIIGMPRQVVKLHNLQVLDKYTIVYIDIYNHFILAKTGAEE